MKKPASIIIIVTTVALLLGWNIGSFFAERSMAKKIAAIPGSPIVVDAKYDRAKHSINYSILNPGGTEVTIIEESFVFTPGKKSKEKAYVVSKVPTEVTLVPGEVTTTELKLKENTEELKIGDVVLVTFTYMHPLSSDIYTVVHSFKFGENKRKNSSKKE